MKVPFGGGTAITVASWIAPPIYATPGYVLSMAVNGTNVYWTTANCVGSCEGASSLLTAPLGGGVVTTLASEGASAAPGIALDATNAYWATSDWIVWKVPLLGGAPTSLASGGTAGIAVDSANVYWTTIDAVLKVPLIGGTPTMLASGTSGWGPLAGDGSSVYWTTQDGTVMKVSVDGGVPITLATSQSFALGIAVDSTSVYWTSETAGTVLKLTPK